MQFGFFCGQETGTQVENGPLSQYGVVVQVKRRKTATSITPWGTLRTFAEPEEWNELQSR